MTSHVSSEDFQLGYSMTGLVERSSNKYVNFQTTHLAFVRRSQSQQSQHQDKLNLFHGDDCHHDFSTKNSSKHLNSFLTNIELSKMMLSNNTGHHSLDNQVYHSAQRLKRSLSSNQRCNSTSSDSSTSTLVEDHQDLNNEAIDGYDNGTNKSISRLKENDQDLILVLPLESVSNDEDQSKTISSSNPLCNLTNKKCCPVQCIDSMSMVSSICPTPSSSSACPPCSSQPFSDCLKNKPPLPYSKNESTGTKHKAEEERTIAQPNKSTKRNFSQFIMLSTPQSKNGLKDCKDSSKEKAVRNDASTKVQISSLASSPRVNHLLNKSPFKEWLL